MEKNFKKFTSFPVALHSLNLNDGHFYPDLQNSANELYTIFLNCNPRFHTRYLG